MRPVILACGDPARADDGAAVAAAQLLAAARPDTDVRICGQLDADDLLAASTRGPCLVLDTVVGPPPGTIVRRSLTSISSRDMRSASTHALPLPATVALAEALGAALDGSDLLGIAGATFELGGAISDEVAAALPAYFAAVADAALGGAAAADQGS